LEYLERFVTGLRSPVVIVSHDREFLARTVTRVVELNLVQQQVGVYDGGYDAYLSERARSRQHAQEAYDAFAETRAGLEGPSPDAAVLDGQGGAQRAAQGDRQRQDRP
jgi:ATPase subunit of ABC transporter with duplicated ATPase domains